MYQLTLEMKATSVLVGDMIKGQVEKQKQAVSLIKNTIMQSKRLPH